jgi:hypothetical protein
VKWKVGRNERKQNIHKLSFRQGGLENWPILDTERTGREDKEKAEGRYVNGKE